MSSAAEAQTLHRAHEHGCCWVVESEQCGLLCGHDSGHVPYVPGDYLPVPLLHPLDAFRLRRAVWPWWGILCPFCGGGLARWEECWPGVMSVQVGAGWRVVEEVEWRFNPCGCEGRQFVGALR